MKTESYPLTLPSDLLQEARQTANDAGLSLSDAMRQGLELGLPKLREQSSAARITNVAPLPDKVARELYAHRGDDTESIRQFIAAQS